MPSIATRLVEALASTRFATALILSWMGLVIVWIVPLEFYALSNDEIKRIVYHEWFFLLVYGLFAVSTPACRQLRRARRLADASLRPRLAGRADAPLRSTGARRSASSRRPAAV